ncbi:MAG: hypothetical protein L0Z62_42365 [Gemmataceae bacterium]|nr:hypothetical protein [Gemmataceae bacterium]
MFRFLFGALVAAYLLAPVPASAQLILPRRVTVVSYYPAPAPIVTTSYLVPAPVVTYHLPPAPAPVITSYAYPVPAPVLTSYAYPAPVPVVTSYSYRVPLLRPFRVIPAPVVVYRP